MIGEIFSSVIGLFVDDELLAIAVLAVVAIIGALVLTGAAPAWIGGLALALALPSALAASVALSAWRMRGSRSE
jgi:hypothetical protein